MVCASVVSSTSDRKIFMLEHKYFSMSDVPYFIIFPIESTVRPRGTWPCGTRISQIHGFDMGPKILQLHSFPNVGHSFTSQLQGF